MFVSAKRGVSEHHESGGRGGLAESRTKKIKGLTYKRTIRDVFHVYFKYLLSRVNGGWRSIAAKREKSCSTCQRISSRGEMREDEMNAMHREMMKEKTAH